MLLDLSLGRNIESIHNFLWDAVGAIALSYTNNSHSAIALYVLQ
ncbi:MULTISPECIES: hypothetical protein [unclassified Microcoleus]